MAVGKRRRSLSNLLIPSFLNLDAQRVIHSPNSTPRSSVYGDYPLLEEPDVKSAQDLLDDDPFANLTTPAVLAKPPTPSPPPTAPLVTPKSPLSPSNTVYSVVRPGFQRTKSHSSASKAVPAYKKPAFGPRPSLPSLDTLAKMSVVVPVKVRKGKVGAGLPSEPWNLPSSSQPSLTASPIMENNRLPGDFTSELESEFDYYDQEEGFTEDENDEILSNYASISPEELCHDLPINGYDDSYQRQSVFMSDHTRTPSSSPERSMVAWPALHLATRTSTDSELSTPGLSDIEDISALSTSPPTELDESVFMFSSYPFGESNYNLAAGASGETVFTSSGGFGSDNIAPTEHLIGASEMSEMKDATDGSQSTRGVFSHQFGTTSSSGGSKPGNYAQGGSSAGGHGRDDEEDKPFRSSPFFTPPDIEEGESSDEEERGRPRATARKESSGPSSEDDNIPLAQRLPHALSAQKTIRRQVRDERDQRRKERALKRLQQQKSPLPPGSTPQLRVPRKSMEQDQPLTRERHDTIRPTGTGSSAAPSGFPSSSQEPMLQSSKSITRPRARTQTLPGRPVAATELTKRLNDLQMTSPPQYPPAPDSGTSLSRRPTRGAAPPVNPPVNPAVPSPSVPAAPPAKLADVASQLRHARSFHRPARRVDEAPSLPTEPSQGLVRSTTRSKGLGRSKSTTRPSTADAGIRPSADAEPPLPTGHSNTRRAPPLDTPAPELPPVKVPLTTYKIYIGDLQTFNVVEVAPGTNAKDIIILLEDRGSLKGWAGAGGWMLWEVCHDFGMERPMRTFELLSEVAASWKDNMANNFILKLTSYAPLLSRSNLPTSSPLCSGYLEYEYKRGKWAKRYLRLRENSLYLSKRDNGKDEQFLCSLSNFDAYLVTRNNKAPKSFVFAVKSTDSLTFFENTADYMHQFSCNQNDGDKWMEKILLARSYVLFQEKNVLFVGRPSTTAPATGLQRSGTRKGASGRAPAPLVDVLPPQIFEPGSLLHKHT